MSVLRPTTNHNHSRRDDITRSIAILALALTAALSADQAFAINAKSDEQLFRDVSIVDQAGGSDIYQQNEHELQPGSSVSKLRDRDDLDNSGSPDTCFSELQRLIVTKIVTLWGVCQVPLASVPMVLCDPLSLCDGGFI